MSKQIPDFLDASYWNNTIKMSLSKFFILCVLTQRSLHGYEISKAVAAKTNGRCAPAEGTVYPVLKQFEAGGYIDCQIELVSGRERKVYNITEKGRQAYNVALTQWQAMTECLQACQLEDASYDASTCCP